MDWVDQFLENNNQVLEMACNTIKSEEYQQLRKRYEMHPRKYMSETHHRKVSTEAANLAKAVIAHGGTRDEAELALKHLYICMDAEKYGLDWLRFRKENGIRELCRKYGKAIDQNEKLSSLVSL